MNLHSLVDDHQQDKIRWICEEVQSLTGIQLGPQKHEMVQGRLSRRLRELRLETLDQYMALLERDPNEKTSLIDILTTNKTSFFREARHFEVLERHLLKTMKAGAEPTVWSAGCSSGEEPYTMAIVARRASIPARILATDISSRVLDTARKGRYPRESVKDMPETTVRSHFVRCPEGVEVVPETKALVGFARLNLLGSWPMRGGFAAIFCRNVMIYFDRATREALARRYYEMLAPGGLLFVGLSESLNGLDHGFEQVEPGAYRR